MEELYDVCFEDSCVGQVRVSRQGLYYCIDCLVKLSGSMKCRLTAQGQKQDYDLGLCVPRGDGMGITTKVPVKYFPEKPVTFVLTNKRAVNIYASSPICPVEPFSDLQRLETAQLGFLDGKMVAFFRD